MRPQESLALYKSFNTLGAKMPYLKWTGLMTSLSYMLCFLNNVLFLLGKLCDGNALNKFNNEILNIHNFFHFLMTNKTYVWYRRPF
jgi:hypothetical protein